MKIVCISASNIKSMGMKSTSTRICHFIKEVILEDKENYSVDVAQLADYDLKTCYFCGDCRKEGRCAYDAQFNRLMDLLSGADGIFIVVPHYSPIPAKLIMLFEKINEILYSGWLNNPEYQSLLYNKPIGLIGHGGMVESEDTLRYYHDHLLAPVANTLKSLSFRVIRYNDKYENGVVFGLKDDTCIKTIDNAVFPEIIQDWPKIEERIKPLINKVLLEINV